MAVYFISDLHLSAERPELTEAFASLFHQQLQDAEALYILGDFFDAWIGDDDDQALALTVKTLLKNWIANGLAVYFMHGNRDFLLGSGFAAETGVRLLEEGTVVELYGRKALLMHGDSLCTGDTDYMQFRAMVRQPAWQNQVLALPLAHRRQLAADLRAKSKSLHAMRAQDIVDVTPSEVEQALAAAEVDLLIHGHTHRPAQHKVDVAGRPAERWVLGDWHEQGWYLRADPQGLKLESFPIARLQ